MLILFLDIIIYLVVESQEGNIHLVFTAANSYIIINDLATERLRDWLKVFLLYIKLILPRKTISSTFIIFDCPIKSDKNWLWYAIIQLKPKLD